SGGCVAKPPISKPVEVWMRSCPRAPNSTVSSFRPLFGARISASVCATRRQSLAEAMLDIMQPSRARMPMRRRRSAIDIDRTGIAGQQVEHGLRHREFAAAGLVAGAQGD